MLSVSISEGGGVQPNKGQTRQAREIALGENVNPIFVG